MSRGSPPPVVLLVDEDTHAQIGVIDARGLLTLRERRGDALEEQPCCLIDLCCCLIIF
jgi:hypothetical protein